MSLGNHSTWGHVFNFWATSFLLRSYIFLNYHEMTQLFYCLIVEGNTYNKFSVTLE